jgi:hypothetical protein
MGYSTNTVGEGSGGCEGVGLVGLYECGAEDEESRVETQDTEFRVDPTIIKVAYWAGES